MNDDAPQATAPESAAKAADQGAGPIGYLAGLALAGAVLLGIWTVSRTPQPAQIAPLPAQLTVVLDLGDLENAEARASLLTLQRELKKLEMHVSGPNSYPLLFPNDAKKVVGPAGPTVDGETADAEALDEQEQRLREMAKKDPRIRNKLRRREGRSFGKTREFEFAKGIALDAATPVEIAAAKPTLASGNFLGGRLLSEDGRFAVIRAAPQRLPGGLRTQVIALLDAHRPAFKGLWAYSQALKLTEPKDKAKVNEVFGAHVLMVPLVAKKPGHFLNLASHTALEDKLKALSEIPGVTLAVSPYAFFQYAKAARATTDAARAAKLDEPDLVEFRMFANRSALPLAIDEGGDSATVEIYTSAEGKALHTVREAAEKILSELEGVRVKTPAEVAKAAKAAK